MGEAAWRADVQRNKELAHEARQAAKREVQAMAVEDAAAANIREHERTLHEAAAALAAAAVESKQRSAAALEAKREEEAKALLWNRMQMASEDRRSQLRERKASKLDLEKRKTIEWEQAVESRKVLERELRGAERIETDRMEAEDRLADALRREEARLVAARRAELEAEKVVIAAAACAIVQSVVARQQALLDEKRRGRERERLAEECRLAGERTFMSREDERSQQFRAWLLSEELKREEIELQYAERDAMAREDALSRRQAAAMVRHLQQEARDFELQKAANVRLQRNAEREAKELAEMQRQQRVEEQRQRQIEVQGRRAEEAAKRAELEAKAAAATKRAHEERLKNATREERLRCDILEEERRMYETLYLKNRSFAAAARRAEVDGDAAAEARIDQPFESSSGCAFGPVLTPHAPTEPRPHRLRPQGPGSVSV